MLHRSTLLALVALLLLSQLLGCPTRGRGNNGDDDDGTGDDDDATGDDDDATGDDDDATGDDDDSTPAGDLYEGSTSGTLESDGSSSSCSGDADIWIDGGGFVTGAELVCGVGKGLECVFRFAGPYAFSETAFIPTFTCTGGTTNADAEFVQGLIYGTTGSVGGSIDAYMPDGLISVSFSASLAAP